MNDQTPEQFLYARIQGVEDQISGLPAWTQEPILVALDAMRDVIDLHKDWPTLVESPMEFGSRTDTPDQIVINLRQKLEWLTREEYKKRFGYDAPLGAVFRKMLQHYEGHYDFKKEWLD